MQVEFLGAGGFSVRLSIRPEDPDWVGGGRHLTQRVELIIPDHPGQRKGA